MLTGLDIRDRVVARAQEKYGKYWEARLAEKMNLKNSTTVRNWAENARGISFDSFFRVCEAMDEDPTAFVKAEQSQPTVRHNLSLSEDEDFYSTPFTAEEVKAVHKESDEKAENVRSAMRLIFCGDSKKLERVINWLKH